MNHLDPISLTSTFGFCNNSEAFIEGALIALSIICLGVIIQHACKVKPVPGFMPAAFVGILLSLVAYASIQLLCRPVILT